MWEAFILFAVQHPNSAPHVVDFFRLAMEGFISWCTFTVSLGGTIIVVRETFKVSKLKALKEEDRTIDAIKDMIE
jgi:hypothetical protein